jgi:alpha-glucosidase (family GH31 glycosyl hydrolase)
MRIEYLDDGFPFGQTNLHVYFRHGQESKERHWYIASRQRGNLQGAIATLDGVAGPVKRQEGLLSRDGWYLIDDSGKDILKDGWLTPRDRRSHLQDLYLFVYGDDYKAALQSLKAISGPAPMPRKYVHGAWYCRWWNYTADDYRQIAREYHQHDFPLDIIVFDMGWHTQNATMGTGHAGTRSWTGYTWNRELIDDPEGLIREFGNDNIYVVLNEHPHDGLRPHEDAYPGFVRELGLKDTDPVPLFDAGDRRYMNAFMKHAHAESDAKGVAFWWLDWQQDYLYPLVRGTNTPHLPWLNKLYYDYSARDRMRGAGFSRWGGWGDHRHPIQFSGDAAANWDVLRFEVDLTTSSGNAGCFFWAHDVGGFYGGRDAELYTRWTQFAMLTSSLRIHSVNDERLDRRPWLWGEEAEQAMRRVYHLRSQLMPYIYTSVRQCHTDMLPLNRGLYIEHPTCEEAYRHPGEFMFGDLLLAAPVMSPGLQPDKTVGRQVWLPQSDSPWFHLFTGAPYAGGQTVEVESTLNDFPLFVKGGHPLPMQPYRERMCSTPLTELIVRCYPGKDGNSSTYDLYEDDGLTTDYLRGQFATTTLAYRKADGRVTVTIRPTTGSYAGQPLRRSYRIELPGVTSPVTVTANGSRVQADHDETLQGVIVSIPATDIRQEVWVEVNSR